MENWGLVTFRETALLIEPASSGVASKQRVAYVVAHELAHQWFGNLGESTSLASPLMFLLSLAY